MKVNGPEWGLAIACAIARGEGAEIIARWGDVNFTPDIRDAIIVASFVSSMPEQMREQIIARAFRGWVESLGGELLRAMPPALLDAEPVRSFEAWMACYRLENELDTCDAEARDGD